MYQPSWEMFFLISSTSSIVLSVLFINSSKSMTSCLTASLKGEADGLMMSSIVTGMAAYYLKT